MMMGSPINLKLLTGETKIGEKKKDKKEKRGVKNIIPISNKPLKMGNSSNKKKI
jgi:hypothetical protein